MNEIEFMTTKLSFKYNIQHPLRLGSTLREILLEFSLHQSFNDGKITF